MENKNHKNMYIKFFATKHKILLINLKGGILFELEKNI